ncbi:MAG: response regulator [Phycisphaeraceae bacterium]|nr:response regulator [Phycisphaeraceae bacterium]
MIIIDRQTGDSVLIGRAASVTVLDQLPGGGVRLGVKVQDGWSVRGIPEAEPGKPVIENGLRVLLVEDEPVHARLILATLQQCSSVVGVLATTAAQAIDQLEQANGDDKPGINLVLLDLGLPDATGQSVLQAARSKPHTRYVPVVILSSRDGEQQVSACLEAGANAFITKMLDPMQLQRSIVRTVDFWRQAQQVHI